MLKNILSAIVLLLFLLTLTACGGDDNNNANQSTENNVSETDTTETEAGQNQGNEGKNEEQGEAEYYFKDNVAQLHDLKIKITETKVIPAGETGNEYGDKPVFAIWYETTNLSDKDIDPTTAWMVVFEAVQDNDPNLVNTLEVGSHPDDQYLDTQLENIKQNGTVTNAVAYELDDLETPVTLIATQGIMGDKLGEQNFEIK